MWAAHSVLLLYRLSLLNLLYLLNLLDRLWLLLIDNLLLILHWWNLIPQLLLFSLFEVWIGILERLLSPSLALWAASTLLY